MEVKLRQVGNSLGVTLPRKILQKLDAEEGDILEIKIIKRLKKNRENWELKSKWKGWQEETILLESFDNEFDEGDWEW